MKEFIIGIGLFMVFSMALIYQQDYNTHQEEIHRLKFVSQEVAASAAQYFERENYGEGYYVFKESEGIVGAEEVLKTNLYLNDDLSPKSYSYWKNISKVEYEMDFVSSNKTVKAQNGSVSQTTLEDNVFPKSYTYTHFGRSTTRILFGPSVIVTVNTGKAKYHLVDILERGENYRTATHTFEE